MGNQMVRVLLLNRLQRYGDFATYENVSIRCALFASVRVEGLDKKTMACCETDSANVVLL